MMLSWNAMRVVSVGTMGFGLADRLHRVSDQHSHAEDTHESSGHELARVIESVAHHRAQNEGSASREVVVVRIDGREVGTDSQNATKTQSSSQTGDGTRFRVTDDSSGRDQGRKSGGNHVERHVDTKE